MLKRKESGMLIARARYMNRAPWTHGADDGPRGTSSSAKLSNLVARGVSQR